MKFFIFIVVLLPWVQASSSSSGISDRWIRLIRPDRSLTGMVFEPHKVDVSTCSKAFFEMITDPSGPDELLRASLHCAKIGRKEPPLVHCSVLLSTVKGKYQQMHLTPFPPGNSPQKLLVECRPVAVSSNAAARDQVNQYLDANGDIVHKDDGLTKPYTSYPPATRYDISPDLAVPIRLEGGKIIDSVAAASYLWVQKVPGFFQLVMHDCQTFATHFLNLFTKGPPTKKRVNYSVIAAAYLSTLYSKPCTAQFASFRKDYANAAEVAALQAKIDAYLTAKQASQTMYPTRSKPTPMDLLDDVTAGINKPRISAQVPQVHLPDDEGYSEDSDDVDEVRPASPLVMRPLKPKRKFLDPKDLQPGEQPRELIFYRGHLVDAVQLQEPLIPGGRTSVGPHPVAQPSSQLRRSSVASREDSDDSGIGSEWEPESESEVDDRDHRDQSKDPNRRLIEYSTKKGYGSGPRQTKPEHRYLQRVADDEQSYSMSDVSEGLELPEK